MPTLQDLAQNFGVTEPFGVMGPYGDIHTGVDLGLPSGTPVPALGGGTIESVFSDSIGGNQVKVKYTSGAEGWFAHLAAIYSQPGDRVDAGTIIGASGATGHVTGPHLHYEERDPSGQLVDPLSESAQTFIGGGSSSSVVGEPECPLGYSYDPATNSCKSWVPGGLVPNVPIGKLIPVSGDAAVKKAVDPVVRTVTDPIGGALNAALGPVGTSINKLGDDLARGTKQLAIAAVIIGAVVVIGYGGARKLLD